MYSPPYSFQPEHCPCDLHFVEWLEREQVTGKMVFHFGTGDHHTVGVRDKGRNAVLGVTFCRGEHDSYARLLEADPSLGGGYQVLLCDINRLPLRLLPAFDVVSLFHLCEYGTGVRLLDGMLERLEPGGRMLFFTGSNAWGRARQLVEDRLEKCGEHKSLWACKKRSNK